MSGYKRSIKVEIYIMKSKIEDLYNLLKTDTGKKSIEDIYSQIASLQQGIRAKKQRLNNVGKSFIQPEIIVIINPK